MEIVRGPLVESSHRVHAAVVDARGRTVASVGDPGRTTYLRSAAKPFQALPLVEDGVADRLGLGDEELAVCCASHEGEPGHLEAVRRILDAAGVEEDRLACGPHAPYSAEEAAALTRAGARPRPIHNNCSGKHAGMLAWAREGGWPLDGYLEPDHPVQRRMLAEVARWTGVGAPDVAVGVDGCGVPCFGVPLDRMAFAFASLAAAAAAGEAGGRLVRAMTGHPWMVAGTGRACTLVMEATGGRAFVKLGAEGVYGGGVPGAGLGFAIKVEDGGRRAVEAALMRVLEGLDVFPGGVPAALERFRRGPVTNTRGEEVGEVRAGFALEAS